LQLGKLMRAASQYRDEGAVRVAGLDVRSGDLIHADRHGAVVVPADLVGFVASAADKVVKSESLVIDLCNSPQFTLDALRDAWSRMGQGH
jgi:regulator of RNase E activity RraA